MAAGGRRFLGAVLCAAAVVYALSVFTSPRPRWLHWAHELVPILVAAVALLFFLRMRSRAAENRELVDRLETTLHELEEALAARDEFVVSASHQLKTPLASLLLRIDLLEEDASLDARQHEYITEMRDQVTRLTRLTRTLLAIMSRDSSLPAESISVSRAIREVVDSVSPIAVAREVSVQTEEMPADDEIVAPEGALEEVALNLVSNAVKYSPRGGTVCVSVARNGDTLRLTVSDEGEGITQDAMTRVFEPGYRGSGGASGAFGPGSGYGLSIAKRICDVVGATISLRPRGDRGTAAEVVWPVSVGTAEVFTEDEPV